MIDWTALVLSLELGFISLLFLIPLGLGLGRLLACQSFFGKSLLEASLALPLVIPPTVLGYYLLSLFGQAAPLGQLWQELFNQSFAFSFSGLLLAAILFNLPLAVFPIQRSFADLPQDLTAAAATCGLGPWRCFWLIEAPLIWPGVISAAVLCFAHTLGEFGVVLMVGGGIPGETKTASIAIFDQLQEFDDEGAGRMAGLLLAVSGGGIMLVHILGRVFQHRRRL